MSKFKFGDKVRVKNQDSIAVVIEVDPILLVFEDETKGTMHCMKEDLELIQDASHTLRDQFATETLKQLMSYSLANTEFQRKKLVIEAYEYANAMLKERQKYEN